MIEMYYLICVLCQSQMPALSHNGYLECLCDMISDLTVKNEVRVVSH